jgi:U3 small nucleolar RNA-associated protein 4
MTATHQLVEFDVLSCRLSEWSRRNPSTYLPQEFTKIGDRVVGSFWDCGDRRNKGERLWLYGSKWLFMLDVSQDLQQHAPTAEKQDKGRRLGRYDVLDAKSVEDGVSKKRPSQNGHDGQHRRAERGSRKRRRHNVGAGGVVPEREREGGLGRALTKFTDDGDDAEMIDLDVDRDSEMDDEDVDDDSLALMRRNRDQAASRAGHNGDDTPRPSYWCTFEYQSILGVAVIGPPPTEQANPASDASDAPPEHPNLEVVIVERDMYDVEQVPRFDDGQD